MIKISQDDLLYLSSTFSRQLKRRFGKGPETCNIMYKGARLYIYLRNFITPAEEVLIDHNEVNLAVAFRSTVMNAIAKEFITDVSKILGSSFDQFFHDWNYETNTGIILIEDSQAAYEIKTNLFLGKPLLERIEEVGSGIHKRPTSIKIIKHTANLCALEMKDVHLQLERVVYEKGNLDLLRHQAWDIRSAYFIHKKVFEDQFGRVIEDLFILPDYKNNRCFLIFVF